MTTYPLAIHTAFSIVVFPGQRQCNHDQNGPSCPAGEKQRPRELDVADKLTEHEGAGDEVRQLPQCLAELRPLTPVQS